MTIDPSKSYVFPVDHLLKDTLVAVQWSQQPVATGNGMVHMCLLEGLEGQWEETEQSSVPPDLNGEAELGLIIKRELR